MTLKVNLYIDKSGGLPSRESVSVSELVGGIGGLLISQGFT